MRSELLNDYERHGRDFGLEKKANKETIGTRLFWRVGTENGDLLKSIMRRYEFWQVLAAN